VDLKINMDIYKTIMNHGFLIFEYNAKFVLNKMPTPTNQMSMSGGQNWEFNSFDDALDTVKNIIKWKDPSNLTQIISWEASMMYRHIGLGEKCVDLGYVESTSFEKALSEARKCAELYIAKNDLEKSINGFDVKIRPCRNQK